MADIAPLLYFRIVQVDLKFPPKPIVSSAAKDLISQVLFLFAFSLSVPFNIKRLEESFNNSLLFA